MIASVRGLVVLAMLAFALLVITVVDRPARHLAVDRTLIPGFVPERVTGLVFERAPKPDLHVSRVRGSWQLASGAADPMTIDAVLSALRGARWHRRAPKARAGTPRAGLRVLAGSQVITLAVGDTLAGTGQVWVVRGDHAYLVDSWVAAALAPEPLALVMSHPLADAPSAKRITVSMPRLRIEGQQLVEPFNVWLEPALLDALYDACAELEIVELAPSGQTPQDPIIALDDATVQLAGACGNNRVRIVGTRSSGCVERAAWDKLTAALAALARPVEQIADRRPVPIKPLTIGAIDLRRDNDPERVAELTAALAERAEIAKRPASPPASTLVIGDGSRQITLELYNQLVARKGEPIALRPSRDAWRIITRPLDELRDPTLWREDPLTITSLTLDKIQYTRGAVLGEWARLPVGAIDPALVDVLVEALATVRAPRAAAPARIVHRISFTVTPPAGTPITHEIEVGPSTADGCRARADKAPVMLPLAFCTATAALAAKQ